MVKKDNSDAARMAALFAGNEGHHGTHGEPMLDPQGGVKWEIRGSAATLPGGADVEMWRKHLSGARPLGVVPIMNDSTCIWGSGDIDDYDINVGELLAKLEASKLPLLPCRSKSGGLHLFLFSKTPIPASLMRSTLSDMMASLGHAGCEIFPKQTKILVDRGEKGSWIVMPYCGTTYGGKLKEQVGLKRTGAEMTIGEFLSTAEKLRVDVETLPKLRSTHASGPKKQRPPFSDGPPCLVHLVSQSGGIAQGGQNNALFHMGVYFKRKHPEDWQKRLEDANQKFCKPPYPSDKLAITIKSLDKKEYQYKCKDQPMASFCDSMQCRARKFGVGAGGTYPQITSISKLDTKPPIWFVDVEGAKIPMSTEDLQTYARFHRLCMEHIHKSFAIISQNVWYGVLNEALQNVDVLDAPPDANPEAQFRELLLNYLTNRQRGKVIQDLVRGAPWEDEEKERHYFQAAALQKFLEREGMRDLSKHRNQLTNMIRDIGGGGHGRDIPGVGFRSLWYVPSSFVSGAAETEPLPTPETKGSEL